jgi:hypothetical protein
MDTRAGSALIRAVGPPRVQVGIAVEVADVGDAILELRQLKLADQLDVATAGR